VKDAIRIVAPTRLGGHEIRGLGAVLMDCVGGGASVSFMAPLTPERAEAFWGETGERLTRGELLLLTAEDSQGRIIGTVQIALDQPENQRHRADLAKMLVHRSARRCGVGAALLAAAERAASEAGRTLLVLDTASADAARLYARHGWQRCGEIPHFALWPDGRPCATTIFYKLLPGAETMWGAEVSVR
jgi:GNAT superfamily N-acetyltransferase